MGVCVIRWTACSVKCFEWSTRIEMRYISAVHLTFLPPVSEGFVASWSVYTIDLTEASSLGCSCQFSKSNHIVLFSHNLSRMHFSSWRTFSVISLPLLTLTCLWTLQLKVSYGWWYVFLFLFLFCVFSVFCCLFHQLSDPSCIVSKAAFCGVKYISTAYCHCGIAHFHCLQSTLKWLLKLILSMVNMLW